VAPEISAPWQRAFVFAMLARRGKNLIDYFRGDVVAGKTRHEIMATYMKSGAFYDEEIDGALIELGVTGFD